MRQEADLLLAETTARPVYQQQALLRIVAMNAETTYGREHGFGSVRDLDDFRSAVPINTYEDFRPYVDRIASGADPTP